MANPTSLVAVGCASFPNPQNACAKMKSRTEIELFHKKIFDFYYLNRRQFPWRETTDRYAVMISEIMLQQTQTERVIPKFEAWLHQFPDIPHLTAAPLRDVLAFWSGLGYNSRAVRLHQCAALINERYGGVVPSQPQLLKQLPGIGEYTSRSIPIFADNGDFAAVDTNIRRIFIHEFALPETISAAKLQEFADAALPCGQSRAWHNALMDYGALHLTSKKSGIAPLTRQSKFAGSKRWYRGRLIKELVRSEALSLREIEERYGDCPWNLNDIIGDLVSEGLVERYENAATGALTTLKIKGS